MNIRHTEFFHIYSTLVILYFDLVLFLTSPTSIALDIRFVFCHHVDRPLRNDWLTVCYLTSSSKYFKCFYLSPPKNTVMSWVLLSLSICQDIVTWYQETFWKRIFILAHNPCTKRHYIYILGNRNMPTECVNQILAAIILWLSWQRFTRSTRLVKKLSTKIHYCSLFKPASVHWLSILSCLWRWLFCI